MFPAISVTGVAAFEYSSDHYHKLGLVACCPLRTLHWSPASPPQCATKQLLNTPYNYILFLDKQHHVELIQLNSLPMHCTPLLS